MSLPRYRFVGTEAAAFVRVFHSPSGVEHRYFLGDKYQKNVMLLAVSCVNATCLLTMLASR